VPGSNELIVYWSGSLQAPVLARIQQLATADGIGLIVAARRVSKAQLTAHETATVQRDDRPVAVAVPPATASTATPAVTI
jgi:hypothetical protein